MHYGKRFLTILIAAAMLFACVPSATAATTFAQQLEATADGGRLNLEQDVVGDVTIEKNVLINLNGHDMTGTVTVAPGYTVYVMDSQTADYTVQEGLGYGKITAFVGNLLPHNSYMQITESSGISFHRIKMVLTSMTLCPDRAGVYYNGMLYGDELVAGNVQCYGIALRTGEPADEKHMKSSSSWSRYYGFQSSGVGNAATGTLLYDIMRPDNTEQVNDTQSQIKIYGSVYVQTKDGQYIFGDAAGYSLAEQAGAADALWDTLTAEQKKALRTMYSAYESIMKNWRMPNTSNKDIDIPI